MAAEVRSDVWEGVAELINSGQERGAEPLLWAMQLSSYLTEAGVSMPSGDVASLFVSHICWSNNVPLAWKFLEKALTLRVVPPMLVLALLSTRAISSRKSYPIAYRLYMELIKRYAFSLPSMVNGPNYEKIMESVDDALNITQSFGLVAREPGVIVVGFVLSTVWQLLDASLEDEGLLDLNSENKSRWPIRTQEMDIDNHVGYEGKRLESHEAMIKMNTILAVELIGEFFRNKLTSMIVYLARRNMPMHCECFFQHLQLLTMNSSALRNSKNLSPEQLLQLTSDTRKTLSREGKTNRQQRFHALMASVQCHGSNHSADWLPVDLFLEDIMDGSQVVATSAAETLTGLVKALQAINQISWYDTFLGLWVAALRLVQRLVI